MDHDLSSEPRSLDAGGACGGTGLADAQEPFGSPLVVGKAYTTDVVDARWSELCGCVASERCGNWFGLCTFGTHQCGCRIERCQHELAVDVIESGSQFDAIVIADDDDSGTEGRIVVAGVGRSGLRFDSFGTSP